MTEPSTPNVAVDLITIHLIITRGLKVSTESSACFAKEGNPDAAMREGLICFVRTFRSVLHAHHLLEDDLVFPYFRQRFPEAPFDLLTAHHQKMVPILNKIGETLEAMEKESQANSLLGQLNQALGTVAEIWHPHIQLEEEHFTVDKARALIGVDEHSRLGRLFTEHSQQHAQPDYLVVPFLLRNLPEERRTAFAAHFPPIVTEQLVPVLWKEKWAPLKPFLLP